MPRIIMNMSAQFEAAAAAKKASYNKKTNTNPVETILKMTHKDFADAPVGAGVNIPVKAGETAKGVMAKARGSFIVATAKGAPWAGRKYSLQIVKIGKPGEEKEVVQCLRQADLDEPKERKTGAGRPRGPNKTPEQKAAAKAAADAANAAKATGAVTVAGGEADKPAGTEGGKEAPVVKDLTK
jgi:hypothetical protein